MVKLTVRLCGFLRKKQLKVGVDSVFPPRLGSCNPVELPLMLRMLAQEKDEGHVQYKQGRLLTRKSIPLPHTLHHKGAIAVLGETLPVGDPDLSLRSCSPGQIVLG